MAIIDLGKVSITWRGTYAGGTAYTPKDAVVYNNASYICIANTTGNLPTDTTYWNVMAAKGVDGTDVGTTITTQGDILYRDGSGLQRLPAGTSGQYLETKGSGQNPVWSNVSTGAYSIKQIYKVEFPAETHAGSVNTAYNFGSTIQVTPEASTDLIDLRIQTAFEGRQASYNGLAIGVHTSDSWDTSTASSKLKVSSGEFGYGMGDGNDSERYQVLTLGGIYTLTELGMSAGTNYHFSAHILVHSPSSGNVKTGNRPTNYKAPFNRMDIIRLGV